MKTLPSPEPFTISLRSPFETTAEQHFQNVVKPMQLLVVYWSVVCLHQAPHDGLLSDYVTGINDIGIPADVLTVGAFISWIDSTFPSRSYRSALQ